MIDLVDYSLEVSNILDKAVTGRISHARALQDLQKNRARLDHTNNELVGFCSEECHPGIDVASFEMPGRIEVTRRTLLEEFGFCASDFRMLGPNDVKVQNENLSLVAVSFGVSLSKTGASLYEDLSNFLGVHGLLIGDCSIPVMQTICDIESDDGKVWMTAYVDSDFITR